MTSIISAPGRQEDYFKFKATLIYIVRPWFKITEMQKRSTDVFRFRKTDLWVMWVRHGGIHL